MFPLNSRFGGSAALSLSLSLSGQHASLSNVLLAIQWPKNRKNGHTAATRNRSTRQNRSSFFRNSNSKRQQQRERQLRRDATSTPSPSHKGLLLLLRKAAATPREAMLQPGRGRRPTHGTRSVTCPPAASSTSATPAFSTPRCRMSSRRGCCTRRSSRTGRGGERGSTSVL